MSLPEIIIWLVVAAVGIPSAWRNPTAAALVLAWLFGQVYFVIAGRNIPVELYAFPDIFVLAVIFAKREWCNQQPYRSTWHQLQCVLFERSPADRAIMLIFLGMWCVYIAGLHPYYEWMLLWALAIAQFLLAGAESFFLFRRTRAVSKPPQGDGFQFAWAGGDG